MATKYQGDKATQQALDAFIKLSRASNAVNSAVNKSIGDAGLTVSQFGVLEALLHLGPSCQRDLANKILKTGGNLTMVIDNLERDGLVQRIRSQEDRRYVQVQLTDTGRALISRIFPGHAKDIKEAFSPLDSSEQAQLGKLCKKLGEGLTNSEVSSADPEKKSSPKL